MISTEGMKLISEELYQALADNMQVWILHVNRDGTVEFLNKHGLALLGRTPQEVLGKNFFDVIKFDAPIEAIQDLFQHILQGGKVIGREGVVRRKDGTPVTIVWSAVPSRGPDGEITGVAGMAVDITPTRLAERALQESEQRYRTLAETADMAILQANPDGTVAYFNRYAEELTGLSREEVLGKDGFKVFAPNLTREQFFSQMNAMLSGRSVADHEVRIQTKIGEPRWILWSGARTLSVDGTPNGVVITGMDITDRKRAEEEIRKLNDELEQRVSERTAQFEAANKELEAFTYSVSHDLRAPLRHIDGFSQMLIEALGEDLPEDAARYLDVIRYSVNQMGKLIDDLLALSRVGRKSLEKQKVDMDALVDDVLSNLSADMKGRDIETVRQELPDGCGDPAALRQVWMNLLSNAVKFTRTREKARIEIGFITRDGQFPVYYVKDNGVGFDMKYAGKLFGVFQRLHRADEFEGTGVGLAIVQRIVVRHGGSVWFEAAPNQGATFYFTLGGGRV